MTHLLLLLAACTTDPVVDELPPFQVTITSPAAQSTLLLGETVALEAEVTLNGEPTDAVLSWSSSFQGDLPDGASDYTPATTGVHALTVTASARRQTAVASVELAVQAPVSNNLTRFTDGLPEAPTYHDMAVGPDGHVWLASDTGLHRLDPDSGAVTTFTQDDGLAATSIRAVAATPDGHVWVGYDGADNVELQRVSTSDDALTVDINGHFDRTGEITSVYRIRIDPLGNLFLATNEGLCVWEADTGLFIEHGHPTHPHLASMGVALTSDGTQWQADQHQISRWRYDFDGNLFDDHLGIVDVWEPDDSGLIASTDLAVTQGDVLWLTSSLYGVARITAGAVGESVVELPEAPDSAIAVDHTAAGVWVATSSDGLWLLDPATGLGGPHSEVGLPTEPIQQLAVDRTTAPETLWMASSDAITRYVYAP